MRLNPKSQGSKFQRVSTSCISYYLGCHVLISYTWLVDLCSDKDNSILVLDLCYRDDDDKLVNIVIALLLIFTLDNMPMPVF